MTCLCTPTYPKPYTFKRYIYVCTHAHMHYDYIQMKTFIQTHIPTYLFVTKNLFK